MEPPRAAKSGLRTAAVLRERRPRRTHPPMASARCGGGFVLDKTAPARGRSLIEETVMVAACAWSADPLGEGYLQLLPRIQTHARICFRDIDCPATKADKIAEAVALGWQWYRRLAERGKDAAAFPMTFASLLAKAVRSGRGLCGQAKAKDVLSPHAQRQHHFRVSSLPTSTATAHEYLYGTVRGQQQLDEFEERLADNTMTPVPDQVVFRIDFKNWLETLTVRERRILRAMARAERTQDLSRCFGVSPGRISQMRRAFADGWKDYCDD